MTRTAPFSAKAIRNACIAAAFAVAPIGLYTVGVIAGPSEEQIAENKANIDRCVELKGDTNACDRINRSKAYIPNGYQPTVDLTVSLRKEAKVKAEADKKAAKQRQAEAEAKVIAERQAKEAAAEAKFQAEGWFQLQPGIYGRWCTQTCSNADVIGSASYWLMEVWAKDRAAGDIYAQINVLEDGVVVGWTNDTAYLSQGQRGVLTFSKYTPGHGSRYTAQLVKFNARG